MGNRSFSSAFVSRLLVSALAAVCGCEADSGPARRIVTDRWDTLFVLGEENVDDTTFADPGLLAVHGGILVVADLMLFKLQGYDMAGRPLWTVGRQGEGPGEFRQPSRLSVFQGGGFLVHDGRNRRTTKISDTGEILEELSTNSTVFFGGYALWARGRLFRIGMEAEDAVTEVDPTTLRSLGTHVVPWPVPPPERAYLEMWATPNLREGPPLWAAGMYLGPFFLVFDGDSIAAHRFLDDIPYTYLSGPYVWGTPRDSAWYGARAVALHGHEIHFLSGGRPPRRVHPAEPSRYIDIYGSDGKYRRSHWLPFDAYSMTFDGTTYFVSRYEPFPQVFALRPREDE